MLPLGAWIALVLLGVLYLNTKLKPHGRIVISRHGKPALDRTVGPKLTWREYVDWWAQYEAGSLLEPQSAPDTLREVVSNCDIVVSSSRPRAIQSAQKATGLTSFEQSDLFIEANLPPPMLTGLRFLPKTWNVLSRIAWAFGHALDGESVTEAKARAEHAAQDLVRKAEQGDVYLAAHGWFNRMMRPELKRQGFKCIRDGGDSYWSFRVYERSK